MLVLALLPSPPLQVRWYLAFLVLVMAGFATAFVVLFRPHPAGGGAGSQVHEVGLLLTARGLLVCVCVDPADSRIPMPRQQVAYPMPPPAAHAAPCILVGASHPLY